MIITSEINPKKPTRVLHLLQRMEPAGVQTFLMNLYRKIDKTKVQFDFLVHYKEENFYDNEVTELGGQVYKLSVREDYNLSRYKRELRSFFSEHDEFNVIHGHMETLSNIWMKEAKRAGIPTRVAHAHTAGFGSATTPKTWVRQLFRYSYPHNATDLFACSKAAGDFMFRGANYEIVPNAIDVKTFRYSEVIRQKARASLSLSSRAFVIGSVGRFHPSKNHSFMLEVFAEVQKINKNSILVLVGEGDERGRIEKKAKALGLADSVLFTGARKDVNELYQVFDAFLLPSVFEGLPLAGIEAQASGCPSFFSTGVSGETGITDVAHFISLSETPRSWAKAIISNTVLDANRVMYADAVTGAGYDIDALAKKMEAFYIERSLCGRTASAGCSNR